MSDEQEIEQKRLDAMTFKILQLEQENMKTKQRNYDQMVDTIRKIITDEIKKNY